MRSLSISPIGTCRINTPLKRAETKYPISINTAGVYGFTHTSDEALQQLRFQQGAKTFRPEVVPIIFRPESVPLSMSGSWHPSDLTIVEISSAKRVRSGDDIVQINYLYRHFADFFADTERTIKFWSLSKRKARAELLEFLKAERTYQLMSPADRALLMSLSMEQQEFAAIKSDMAEIVDRLAPNPILFMTHVNATTADGSTIPSRARLIGWVKLAAQQLQVDCFDPSEAMRDFSQERAMEQGGLDLTHFTPAFSDHIYQAIHRDHVMHLAGGRSVPGSQDDGARGELIADNIDAVIRYGDFFSGAAQLYAALRETPEVPALIQLRGRLMTSLGNFEAAMADLVPLEASSTLSEEGRLALLDAFTGAEAWEPALRLSQALIGDEYGSTSIYECAAQACEHLDRFEEAATHWKQAFRHDRSNLRAALKGLALLLRLGESEQLDAWRQEIIGQSSTSAKGAVEIGLWALQHRDNELLAQAFGALAGSDPDEAENLLRGAASAEMLEGVARGLHVIAGLEDLPKQARRRFEKLAVEVATRSAQCFADGQYKLAYQLANAARAVKPDKSSVHTVRKVGAHYRNAVRAAYSQRNYAGVMTVANDAGDTIFDSLDSAVLVAVSLSKVGRNAEALEMLLRIVILAPDNFVAQRWAGRIASAGGDFAIALEMYSRLKASEAPDAARYAPEVMRFFATAQRRAFKQFRALVAEEKFAAALDLAALMTREFVDGELIEKEVGRLNRHLRIRLREIEQGGDEEEEREPILRLLLRMQPDDEVVLRRCAIEMMRQLRFDEAEQFWGRMDELRPGVETTVRNLQRCRLFADRQRKDTKSRTAIAA